MENVTERTFAAIVNSSREAVVVGDRWKSGGRWWQLDTLDGRCSQLFDFTPGQCGFHGRRDLRGAR